MRYTAVLRWFVRLSVLIAVTILAFSHQFAGGGPGGAPSVHTVCPFGGLENLWKGISGQGFIPRLAQSNVILIAAVILLTLFFGRFFCGWICSLGTLQDIFAGIGKKAGIKRLNIEGHADRAFRSMKFIALLLILVLTWKTGALIINSLDPFAAYAHIPAGFDELLKGYAAGFIILLISLAGSMFIPRLFCRYLCPLGAFTEIAALTGASRITRDMDTCVACGRCDEVCPSYIKVSESASVSGGACIGCMECVETCPTRPGSLYTALFGRRLRPLISALVALGLFFGIMGLSRVTGLWKQLPETVREAAAGDAANIFGWMSFDDVSGAFGIPLDVIYEQTGLAREVFRADMPIKDMDALLEESGAGIDHSGLKALLIRIAGASDGFTFGAGMTMLEIAAGLKLTVAEVKDVMGVDADLPADIPLDDLAAEHGLDMDAIRDAVLRHIYHARGDCSGCPGC